MSLNPASQTIVPLLTAKVRGALDAARRVGAATIDCSLDLGRTITTVTLERDAWHWRGRAWPFLDDCRDRTIYAWTGARFEPVQRYGTSLIKLVPTEWGPPTFEIDGIKMLPTAQVSPWDDAARKVALVEPRGRTILDTCGGLGYFAAWCLAGGAAHVRSFEKNPDVIWLRSLNPWSPGNAWSADPARDAALSLEQGDVAERIADLPDASFDAVLHDPPRFGIAGELYSQAFYDGLARVLKRGGRLFHYTGTPNRLTSGRDVPREVARRLQRAGFTTQARLDGMLAVRSGRR